MLFFSKKTSHIIWHMPFFCEKRQDTSINVYHFLIKTNMTHVHINSNLIMSNTIKMLVNVF